ncbi:MAG: 4'-phosphopantetheinyl transferase superfamily protein [Bacteroidales bacterium]|nr:4'-phosphopantetheinyl transferase superfamily protein [Bacteroidales bacterium]MBN2755666.1 4'-phosphopantetheinyl transferase superfamily protein [Bacteroidales bacterium]
MPVSILKNINDSKLGLWKLDESYDILFEKFISLAPKSEIQKLDNFSNENRKIEWIACRLLLYTLIEKPVEVSYDEFGKPYLADSNLKISISHTKSIVAVILGQKNVSIDVEKVSERILKIAPKFLYPVEINSVDINNQILHFHAYWCAKETIYKIYGEKRLDFKNNIKIEKFNLNSEGEIKGAIDYKSFKEQFILNYFIHKEKNIAEDFIVVYYC